MTPTPEHNAPDTIWAWKWNCPGVRDNLKASWSNFEPYFDPWVTRGFPSLKFPLGVPEEHLTVATQYTRTDTIPTWQDISTAPRDGTSIMTYPHYRVTHWSDEGDVLTTTGNGWAGSWDDYAEAFAHIDPTHWMPLPPAPTEGADT